MTTQPTQPRTAALMFGLRSAHIMKMVFDDGTFTTTSWRIPVLKTIITAGIVAPRLALAAGMVTGLLLWLCTVLTAYPCLALSFSFGCLLMATSVPCIVMGRLRQLEKPQTPYGRPLAEWTKYEIARKEFEARELRVQRLMIHWNVGLVAGFLPLTFISLTF